MHRDDAEEWTNSQTNGPLWVTVLGTAMAAGMGWGIRGQYGHETGAMIAGALASTFLVFMFCPHASSLAAARAAAMMTVGIGIGGTMTYGQTIGLTQDQELIGNWNALLWGMLGLFIKGAIWIGFGGVFLGMGLSGVRYRPLEMFWLILVAVGFVFIGKWCLNAPFDPAQKILPWIYFSDSWYFEPDKVDMKPRPEIWGGVLVALLGIVAYVGFARKDKLAVRMAIIGFMAGGLGFSGGQCIQAFRRWNAELFTTGSLSSFSLFSHINWWNMMEISFGLIWGTGIAIGLWFNRRYIVMDRHVPHVAITPTWEIALLAIHMSLLLAAEFLRLPGVAGIISQYANYGLIMCLLPLVGIVGGRLWPYLLILPVVAAPICGKQLRALVYQAEPLYSVPVGWVLFAMIPIAVTCIVATWLISHSHEHRALRFAVVALMTLTWLYCGMNTYFFQFAWPWREWTNRTPSQAIFVVCGLGLTAIACTYSKLAFKSQ